MLKPLIYSIALLLCINAQAQVMPFKNYGIRDGLNDNNVQAVIRDDKGLLWVGTDFGVTWFDGKRFYQPQVKTNIGQFYVNGFYKDWQGTIWILTFFNGIYKYQHGRFTNYLVNARQNDVTTNTADGMLQVSANKYVVISQNCAYLFNGQKVSVFDPANPILKTGTNSVTQLPDETILFSTNAGVFLYRFDKGKLKFIDHVLKSVPTSKIQITKNQLWVLTGKGVSSFDNTGVRSFSNLPQNYLTKKAVKDITADKNGTLWALTGNGSMWALTDTAFKIKNGKVTQYTAANGLPENIQQIYCDNQGLVWFANRKGISMLADEYYEFNRIKNDRNDYPVISLATDPQNNLWIGSSNGLVLNKDSKYIFYRNVGKQSIGYIQWFHRNKNGSFYAGTTAGVLSFTENLIKKQFNINATAIDTDKEGNTWYGGIDGLIWVDEGKGLKPLKIDHPVVEMIIDMHRENEYLWVGYRDRGIVVYRVDNGSLFLVKEYSVVTGYNDIRIRSCTTDKKGNIIWGTRTNGIFIFSMRSNRQVAHISTENGLNANWIRDIFCDTDGKLYLATNNGINIVLGDYKKPLIKQLKINNDNINRETNCILKTGNIFYIGTNEGVLKWMPGNMRKDTISPPIYFTHIDIQGVKNFSVAPYTINGGEISLPYDQHTLSFEFAGVSLKNPENVGYRYILEGENNAWSPVTDHNFVTYNLKPGNYTFKVTAKNADEVWSHQPAVFHFIIKPPFWQTWWFLIIMAIIIIMAAYGAYRYKLSKMLALELLRNKISTDLHDDIGSTLSSISILSEVAVKEDQKKSKLMLGEINERSHQLMEKMDDIVWSISTRNDTVGNLFIRIQQFASTVMEAKDIDYDVQVPGPVKEIKLDMQLRQHIYLILKEAINNLIKYSCCTSASIIVEYTGRLLKISVSDNGRGFDIKTVNLGNGLNNMQKRTDEMHGTLLIVSAPGSGTRVILSVEIE